MAAYGPHYFHIPVMGTGFTIDTPLKIGKYGVSSVVSIVDDVLIEQMRKYYSEKYNRPYEAITKDQEDARGLRVEKYLNLLQDLVDESVEALKKSDFTKDSEITRYFNLLPEGSEKSLYREMLATSDTVKKTELQEQLRALVTPGTTDVNIMTKLDRDIYKGSEILPHKFADAMSALRGYGLSRLDSNIVFSAGLNQKLYSYITEFPDFFPDENGYIKKRVTLKVSDYRSALIQGRFLAKKGIWVSEYRIESGLNCGGHAFATQGVLQGPILEEFRTQREELIETLFPVYQSALRTLGKKEVIQIPKTYITMQGGIGTPEEQSFLINYYRLDRTGWGTPFLFVREVTQIDDESFEIIKAATKKDAFLSDASPLGISFWNLRNSPSENYRKKLVAEGKPGSPCPKGFLVSNTEFSVKPICTASKGFQGQKMKQISAIENMDAKQLELYKDLTLAKACICHDLSGGVTRRLGIDLSVPTAICTGPNVINYNREISLEEMIDHIYGRGPSVVSDPNRPHVFIREAELYVDYYEREKFKTELGMTKLKPDYFTEFKENMLTGIAYYESLKGSLPVKEQDSFAKQLLGLKEKINGLIGLKVDSQEATAKN
jgi:hypothetical protein